LEGRVRKGGRMTTPPTERIDQDRWGGKGRGTNPSFPVKRGKESRKDEKIENSKGVHNRKRRVKGGGLPRTRGGEQRKKKKEPTKELGFYSKAKEGDLLPGKNHGNQKKTQEGQTTEKERVNAKVALPSRGREEKH